MLLVDHIRAFAARHSLWHHGSRVIAALSGGSDSVALVLLLHDLHTAGDLVLDAAAHLHHGSRGADADDDQWFCAALCDRLGVPFVTEKIDVPALASRDRVSFEIAARRARHRFLEELRLARKADVVATAHTRNDQAETVLLRVVRGAGVRGVGGISPRRAHLIRPVLEITRDELRAELSRRGQPWREDVTNEDVRNPRNRVRHELIPYLALHFNPAIVDALARLADVARADEAWLTELAQAAADEVISTESDHVRVNAAKLSELPEPLSRRLARHALELARPDRAFSLEQIDLVRAIAAGEPAAAEISGLRVERFGDSAVLIKRAATARPRRRGVSMPW